MAYCTPEKCMFIPRCFRCTAKANRASAARSRQKRIANLENLRSDNAELEWKNEEAAAELAKIKKKNQELCNKNESVEYNNNAVLSYLKFKSTPQ